MSHVKGYFVSHMKNIGERIASIRGNQGVGAFAESIGVNRKTIQRWEAGLAIPDGNSILLLKEKFGVDPSWLLTGESPASVEYGIVVSDAEEVELVQTYRKLARKSRVALRNLFRVYASTIIVGVEMPARPEITPEVKASAGYKPKQRFGVDAQPGKVPFQARQNKQALTSGKPKSVDKKTKKEDE